MGLSKKLASLAVLKFIKRTRFGVLGVVLPIAWRNREMITEEARDLRNRLVKARRGKPMRTKKSAPSAAEPAKSRAKAKRRSSAGVRQRRTSAA